MDRVHVRTALAADLSQIAAIDDEQVAASHSTFDLQPRPLLVWESRLASAEPGDHVLVAAEDDTVLGYASSGPYRPKPAYSRTRELTVYVAAPARGRGVGRRLYDVLLAALQDDEMHLVVAVVALPNTASEALHQAFGFERVGVLPEVGLKFGRWIDTAIYTRLLRPDA